MADSDDGELDVASNRPPSSRDAVILLIDTQELMFHDLAASGELSEDVENSSAFEASIRCGVAFLQDKIISCPDDLVAVVFFGTKKTENINDINGVYTFQDLDEPDANRILDLEGLLERSAFSDTIGSVQSSDDVPLAGALWVCAAAFSTCKQAVGHRRIFLFTVDDSPHSNDPLQRNQAFRRAHDLSTEGIEIELFALSTRNHVFDARLFYQELVTGDEEDEERRERLDGAVKMEELLLRLRRKEFQKRSFGSLDFQIVPDLKLAVKLYALVMPLAKPTAVSLDAKTNKLLKVETRWVAEGDGRGLISSEIDLYTQYGGERVIFTKEEVEKIKSIAPEGLVLLGFKDMTALKQYHNLTHSTFVFPDESRAKGSSCAFFALLQVLFEQNKFMLCSYVPRKLAHVRLVALVPQREELYDDGAQRCPDGFHLIPLPYADDIRPLEGLPAFSKVPDDHIKAAVDLVSTISIDFDPADFPNPVLQKHYANLQSIALNRDACDVADYIQPDVEGMEAHRDVFDRFRRTVMDNGDESSPAERPHGEKRKDRGESSSGRNKRAKDAVVAYRDWATLCASGEIKKLTVRELTAHCEAAGIRVPSRAKKAQLVECITQYTLR